MIRRNIGRLLNTTATNTFVSGKYSGFYIDAAVLPLGVTVKNDKGDVQYPRKGEKLYFPTNGGYTFTFPDTWAGNINSTYGRIETFEGDAPPVGESKGEGIIQAMFFADDKELAVYVPPRELATIHVITRLESVAVNERYMFTNIDAITCEMTMLAQSSGYYSGWIVYSGESPADYFDLQAIDVLGYLSQHDTTVDDFQRPKLSIGNVNSLGVICFNTSITLSNQEVALHWKFVDKPQHKRVQGISILAGELSIPAAGTYTLDIPYAPADMNSYFVRNDGGATISNVAVYNLCFNPVDSTYDEVSTIMTLDASFTSGEASATKQFGGIQQAIRIVGTFSASASQIFWQIMQKHY